MTKRPSARWRLARIEEFLTRAHGEIDAMSDEGRHISARLRGCSITIGLMIDKVRDELEHRETIEKTEGKP